MKQSKKRGGNLVREVGEKYAAWLKRRNLTATVPFAFGRGQRGKVTVKPTGDRSSDDT